jgi:hypothetical protein
MIRTKRKAGSFDLATSISHSLISPFRSSDKAVDANAVMAVMEATDKEIQHVPLINALIDERGHGVSNEIRFTQYGLSSACSKIGLPAKFLNEVSKTNPKLGADILNHRIKTHGHDLQAVLHQGRVEGVVSNGYVRLPNVRTVQTVLDRGMNVQSFQMTGLRMRMTTMKRESFAEVQRGDIVGTGMSMRNSEDGRWAFDVDQFMLRLMCTNGMVSQVGNISGYSQHRGNIADKAAVLISRADTDSNELLQAVRKSLTSYLNNDQIVKLRSDVSEHFENISWGNRVVQEVAKEANRWNRQTPAVFDAWNAVTGLHTECGNNIERLLEVQNYGREVLNLAN